MVDHRHYSSSVCRPSRGSRYEFFAEGLAVFELEDNVGFFDEPFPIPESASPRDIAVWERVNRIAAQNAALVRAMVRESLAASGVPEDQLLDQPAIELGRQLVAGWRASLALRRFAEPTPKRRFRESLEKSPSYDRKLCQWIVFASHLMLAGQNPRQVAYWLNDGARNGISGEHVRRVLKQFPARLVRLCSAAADHSVDLTIELAGLQAKSQVERLRILDYIRSLARKQPEFRDVDGAALVAAIEDQYGFHGIVTRAERHLFPQERAA